VARKERHRALLRAGETSMERRQFFRVAAGVLGYASSTALLESAGLAAGPPIKIGNILDKTGPLNIYCLGQIDAIAMAVDDLNRGGGLLGRPLQLLFYDSQSNNQFNAQYATRALLEDRVDVLHAGVTSSSREVMRPIVHRYGGLYFYNSMYEGGVCDRLFYNTGITPGQQFCRCWCQPPSSDSVKSAISSPPIIITAQLPRNGYKNSCTKMAHRTSPSSFSPWTSTISRR
jgi:ABC-type branched-subunit amino acid transport system substrate-binding protein